MIEESFEINSFLTALEALMKNKIKLSEREFRKLLRNFRQELNETLEEVMLLYTSDEVPELLMPQVEVIIESVINHSYGITRILKYLKTIQSKDVEKLESEIKELNDARKRKITYPKSWVNEMADSVEIGDD